MVVLSFANYSLLVQNAPNDVVKVVYDVCFDAVIRIVLQSDDHSEMQVIFFAKLAYPTLILYMLFMCS